MRGQQGKRTAAPFFIEGELSDPIFVLNISTVERRLLWILRLPG